MTTIRSFACAVALLLASEPAAASWGRVQAVPSGTRASVQVPNRPAAKGQRVTRGSLESVTEDSVVVRTKDSALRSIPRNRILRLKVYVLASKRGKAWAITGSLAAVSLWVFPYVAGRGPPIRQHAWRNSVFNRCGRLNPRFGRHAPESSLDYCVSPLFEVPHEIDIGMS